MVMKPNTVASQLAWTCEQEPFSRNDKLLFRREFNNRNNQMFCAKMLEWNLEWALSTAVFMPSGQWCCCPQQGLVQDVISKGGKQLAEKSCSSWKQLPTTPMTALTSHSHQCKISSLALLCNIIPQRVIHQQSMLTMCISVISTSLMMI